MRTEYDDPSTPFRNLIILKIFFEGVGPPKTSTGIENQSLFFYLDFLEYANGVRRSFYSVQKSHNFEDIFRRDRHDNLIQKLQPGLAHRPYLVDYGLVYWIEMNVEQPAAIDTAPGCR